MLPTTNLTFSLNIKIRHQGIALPIFKRVIALCKIRIMYTYFTYCSYVYFLFH